eukprot:3743168-Pleurochrysis_carterae.AAC.1
MVYSPPAPDMLYGIRNIDTNKYSGSLVAENLQAPNSKRVFRRNFGSKLKASGENEPFSNAN